MVRLSLLQVLQGDIQFKDGRGALGGSDFSVVGGGSSGAVGEVTADALETRTVLLSDL